MVLKDYFFNGLRVFSPEFCLETGFEKTAKDIVAAKGKQKTDIKKHKNCCKGE